MKLLFIGDSLIEYFDWQERFPKHAVYNMGIAGETVEVMNSRIEVVFKQVDYADAIFIMSGINNIATGDKKFIPLYRKAAKKLKEHYGAIIFIHSLLPVLFPWISDDDIQEINIQLKQMAAEENLVYLDLYPRFLEEGDGPIESLFLEDGVHLSARGYQAWADEIERVLKNNFAGANPGD
jgi:lysophospholipase L1-like esterase